MSSPTSILKPILENDTIELYLYCRPILNSNPQDIPELKLLTDGLWSAKINIMRKDSPSKTINFSEWFSIPFNNIQQVTYTTPKDEFLINLDLLSVNEIEILLTDTKPIFNLNNRISTETAKWLQKNYTDEYSS